MSTADDDFPVPPLEAVPDTDGKHTAKQPTTREKQSASAKARGTGKRDASGHFVSSKRSKALDSIREDVTQTVAGVGTVLMPIGMPLTGGVLVDTSPRWADAVVAIAENNPRVLEALTKGTGYIAWAQIAMLAGTVAVAAAAETGRIPVDGPVARNLGVTDVYDRLVAEGAIPEAVSITEAPRAGSAPNADDRPVPASDLVG